MLKKDINKTGKLTHMVATDLFLGDEATQVFNAKSGKWIATIRKGQELNFEPDPEELKEVETVNPNQLILF